MVHPEKNLMSALYILLAVVFATAGVVLLVQLKKSFPDFYKKYSCLLLTAVIVLSLPLLTRSALDALSTMGKFSEYIQKEQRRNTTYNMLFFLITTYIPLICQTASLIFGFVRKKQ